MLTLISCRLLLLYLGKEPRRSVKCKLPYTNIWSFWSDHFQPCSSNKLSLMKRSICPDTLKRFAKPSLYRKLHKNCSNKLKLIILRLFKALCHRMQLCDTIVSPIQVWCAETSINNTLVEWLPKEYKHWTSVMISNHFYDLLSLTCKLMVWVGAGELSTWL